MPTFALMTFGALSRRGWLVGALALAVYGWIGLGMAFVPDRFSAWTRRHPVLDGALLGPLVLLAVAQLTSWPLWVCVVLGLAGAIAGAARGMQRHRRWSSPVLG